MARTLVTVVFGLILLAMLSVTTWASLERNVITAGADLIRDRWFQATLADAYCGFITFYAWLFWRESCWGRRVAWFLAIMLLGNIAMSAYVLKEVWRLRRNFTVERLLLRDAQNSSC